MLTFIGAVLSGVLSGVVANVISAIVLERKRQKKAS